MASTPETADHTSIKLRIGYWKKDANQKLEDQKESLLPKLLMPRVSNLQQPMPTGLFFIFIDHIELVDRTGKTQR